jgi:hypothetical protein
MVQLYYALPLTMGKLTEVGGEQTLSLSLNILKVNKQMIY